MSVTVTSDSIFSHVIRWHEQNEKVHALKHMNEPQRGVASVIRGHALPAARIGRNLLDATREARLYLGNHSAQTSGNILFREEFGNERDQVQHTSAG